MNRRELLALGAYQAANAKGLAAAGKRDMIVRSRRPEDLEMPLAGFRNWITPADRFFVRSHHFTPAVSLDSWRLEVKGMVASPLSLSMAELRRLPKLEFVAVLECAGNGRGLYEPSMPGLQWKYGAVGNARWAGVRLADVLRKAGVRETAREILFDGFYMKTAYRHPGRPVEPGAAVDPASMQPVTALRVKSVIATPEEGALPARGPVRIEGAAWSESSAVEVVEVSTDGGRTWSRARLGREQARYGWRLWEFEWTPARDGYHTLLARARDAAGDTQPFSQEWNPSGYLYNAVHQVGVNVNAEAMTRRSERKQDNPPKGFRTSCLTCHETDVIERQRLTREQWEREIDKMIRWGARVRPEEREGILEFLSRGRKD